MYGRGYNYKSETLSSKQKAWDQSVIEELDGAELLYPLQKGGKQSKWVQM